MAKRRHLVSKASSTASSLTSSIIPIRDKAAGTPKNRTGKITLLSIKQQLQKNNKGKVKKYQAGSTKKKNISGPPALKWPPSDPVALQAAKEELKKLRIKTRSNPAKKEPRKKKNPQVKVFVVEAYSHTSSTSINRRPKERLIKTRPHSKH